MRAGVVDDTQAMALKHLDTMANVEDAEASSAEQNWWDKQSIPVSAEEQASFAAADAAAMASQARAAAMPTILETGSNAVPTAAASVPVPAAAASLSAECREHYARVHATYDDAAAQHGFTAPAWPAGLSSRVPLNVPGLVVLEDYLSGEEQERLLHQANRQKPEQRPEWQCSADPYDRLCVTCPAIPNLDLYVVLKSVCARLERDGLISHMPGTLTINYYEAHEGLRPHTDNPVAIAELVVGFSLGASCVMDFASVSDPSHVQSATLPPGSVVIQQGEARYQWTHGIQAGAIGLLPADDPRFSPARISVQLSDFDPAFFADEEVQTRSLAS